MKKLIRIMTFVLAILLFTNTSCNKDQLQPTWLWLKKEKVIFKTLLSVHNNSKTAIDNARTTIGDFYWGDDLIVINGPAAYEKLADHATADFRLEYRRCIMEDPTQLSKNSMLANLINDYLARCREYDEQKAFDKMYITISPELYEMYPRFWERFLTKLMDYFTGHLAGSHQDNPGTRSLVKEVELWNLFDMDDTDFQDNWQCNCKGSIYIDYWYLNYADGPDKSLMTWGDPYSLDDVQHEYAIIRYDMISPNYPGLIDDYKVQYNKDYNLYYIGIPLNNLSETINKRTSGGVINPVISDRPIKSD